MEVRRLSLDTPDEKITFGFPRKVEKRIRIALKGDTGDMATGTITIRRKK
jgi:hypothetical protein